MSREQGYGILRFSVAEPFSSVGTVSVITHIHDPYTLAVCTIDRDRLNA